MRRSLLALALAAALSGCGDAAPPTASASDGGAPAGTTLARVTPGAEKSGSAVRLLWVIGADGSRTRLDVPLYASRLSADQGLPVLCVWERPVLSEDDVLCVPSWPTAIRESGLPLYATSGCREPERLVFEPASSRSCAGGRAAYAVRTHEDAAMCQTGLSVWEVQQIPTPAQTYGMRDGTCRPLGAGNPALVYYRTGREVASSELPQGTLGAE